MESGWIITYKDGRQIIMNERAYKVLKDESKVIFEEHWSFFERGYYKESGT